MIEGKTRFAQELSKEEELHLIENATPGSTKKVTKYGIKIFQEPLRGGEEYFELNREFPGSLPATSRKRKYLLCQNLPDVP